MLHRVIQPEPRHNPMRTPVNSDILLNALPRSSKHTDPIESRYSFNTQLETAKHKLAINMSVHGMSENEAVLDVVFAGGVEICSLFRYCLARHQAEAGNNPVAFLECYKWRRKSAATIYWQDHELLDTIWRSSIPDELKQYAATLFKGRVTHGAIQTRSLRTQIIKGSLTNPSTSANRISPQPNPCTRLFDYPITRLPD